MKHKPLFFLTSAEQTSEQNPKILLRRRGRPSKIHQCELCMKVVKSRESLLQHIQCVHEGRKDYKCHICDKKWGRKEDLKKHLKRHERIQDHICHICGRGFVFSYELRRHVSKKLCSQHSQKRAQLDVVLEEAYQRCANKK